MGTCRVDARNNEVSANMALVTEEMLLQQGHAGHHAGLAASGEGVELEVRRDDGGGELGVGSGTGTCAPYLRCNVVKLLTVLPYRQ